jgi:hypothetical protein
MFLFNFKIGEGFLGEKAAENRILEEEVILTDFKEYLLLLTPLKINTVDIILNFYWILFEFLGIKVFMLVEVVSDDVLDNQVTLVLWFANLSRKVIIQKLLIAVTERILKQFPFQISRPSLELQTCVLRQTKSIVQFETLILFVAHHILAFLTKLKFLILKYSLYTIRVFF